MIVTRDEILDAIDVSCIANRSPFVVARLEGDAFTRFAQALGAEGRHYQDKEQGQLFLAFMLTWYDDIAATAPHAGHGGRPG